jgi:hypothetical protein
MEIKPPFSGNVKEYSMESYICNENGEEILDNKAIWKYDENNKIFEVQNYDANNELLDISYYIYDNDQNLLEIIVKAADESNKQNLVYEYKDNKLSQITDTTIDYKVVTTFDDHGNPLEKQNIGLDESPFSVTKYINLYDQNDRLVEKYTVFPSGGTDRIDKYKYNDHGLLIEEQRIKHQMTSTIIHRYNDKGDLILSEFNPGEINSETLKKEIVYNGNNDIIEIKEYRKGWCYQDFNDTFGLTSIIRYDYIR